MRIAWITGVNGFTGRHLVNFLKNKNIEIVGIDIHKEKQIDIKNYYQTDINNRNKIKDLLEKHKPTFIFHLAGLLPGSNEKDLWYVNVAGTVNLMRCIAENKYINPRVLVVGSAAEYNKKASGFYDENTSLGGETAYGRSKWAQTTLSLKIGKEENIDVVIARTFNLIGPGLPKKLVASELCEQFLDKNKRKLSVGNIDAERDFIDMRDAVAAYWKVVSMGRSGEVYNICTGRPVKIRQLIDILTEITGRTLEIIFDEEKTRRKDIEKAYGDNTKITNELGWSPIFSLKQSLNDMLKENENI